MRRLFACFVFFVLLESCSDSNGDGHENPAVGVNSELPPLIMPDSLRDGMMRIAPNGASVLLNNQMRVKLDYAYSLGIHEVTCGEFEKISKEETWYFSLDCTQDDLPVINVSYYDAVLFANAYSKSLGYDSVYVYHRAFFQCERPLR